jgi:ribose/xylose/arabinose/galactoside ABC-type transport system permease subunit
MNDLSNSVEPGKTTTRQRATTLLRRPNTIIVIVAAIITIVLSTTIPEFMRVGNILNMLEQLAITGFLAIGMTYVFIGGGIDLSMTTVVSAAAVVGAKYMVDGGSIIVGCLMIIGVALVFGLINGVAIAYLRMTPFIVTLATMFVAQGFAIWYTRTVTITGIPRALTENVAGVFFGIIPIPAVIVLVFVIITAIILQKTKYGRWLYLLGNNEQTARVSGVPTNFAKFTTYLFSSFTAGITAIIVMSLVLAATTNMVTDLRLIDIISATIIGGASLTGGTGSVVGTILGVLFLTVVGNCFNLLNVNPYIAMAIKGIIIVIIIGLDVLRSRASR